MLFKSLLRAALAISLLALAATAGAQSRNNYEVTITNLTLDQVFSPILVVSHSPSISLFEPGQPASPELAAVAEAGDNGPLQDLLAGVSQVRDTGATDGPLFPGESASVTVSVRFRDVISAVSMLVNTNDAFLALESVSRPRGRDQSRHNVIAYDAGSEPNDELCANIPGPACGGAGGSPDADGEGFIFVHPGIHGVGDLEPSQYDWRNPVAKITIQRVR